MMVIKYLNKIYDVTMIEVHLSILKQFCVSTRKKERGEANGKT